MLRAKFLHVLVLAVFIASLAAPAHAQALKVVVNDVSPQPVEPGKDLTLRVTYVNDGKDFAGNVAAVLDLSQPFVLKGSTESFEGGFELCAFCSKVNTYFIGVDPAAKSGSYPILIRLNRNNIESVITITAAVRGRPNIVLLSEPVVNATPGGRFAVETDVANVGTGTASQVKVISKSPDFVALGSSAITFGSIGAGSMSRAAFEISADESLKAGSYSLPFEISYIDESGSSFNVTQNIGVRVVNDGLLNVESIKVASDSGQPAAGQPVSVVIRLENIGHGNANSIQSEITCSGRSAKAFLGQLKRDEDAPAVFEIILPSGGRHECVLVTNYTDDLGSKGMTNSFEVTVRGPELPVTPVALLIILAAGAYYMRKRRAKEK